MLRRLTGGPPDGEPAQPSLPPSSSNAPYVQGRIRTVSFRLPFFLSYLAKSVQATGPGPGLGVVNRAESGGLLVLPAIWTWGERGGG